MKKFLTFLIITVLILTLSLSLFACSKKDSTDQPEDESLPSGSTNLGSLTLVFYSQEEQIYTINLNELKSTSSGLLDLLDYIECTYTIEDNILTSITLPNSSKLEYSSSINQDMTKLITKEIKIYSSCSLDQGNSNYDLRKVYHGETLITINKDILDISISNGIIIYIEQIVKEIEIG